MRLAVLASMILVLWGCRRVIQESEPAPAPGAASATDLQEAPTPAPETNPTPPVAGPVEGPSAPAPRADASRGRRMEADPGGRGKGEAAEEQGPQADDESSLWIWTDASGDTHYGLGSQVPPEARRSARPVTATVGSVSANKFDPAEVARVTRPAPRSAKVSFGETPGSKPPPKLPAYDHFQRSRDEAWTGATGGTWTVNTKPQKCVTKNNITTCSDAQ